MLKKLQAFNQWVVSSPAISKAPLQVTGEPASVTDASNWATYEQALKAVKKGIGTHIGFVFTATDPFCVFDLDNKAENPETQQRNDLIVQRATEHGHYCEVSFSGKGYHIIYEGTQLTSRRRGNVEFYTSGRYIIITQDANGKAVAVDTEKLFDELYSKEFPDEEVKRIALEEMPEVRSDEDVMDSFRRASNGHYNAQLYDEEMDGDASQLDQSLIERLCFYTEANEQVRRLFKASVRGKRAKVQARGNEYINRSIQHSRAVNQEEDSPLDLEQLKALMHKEPVTVEARKDEGLEFPPGLAGLMSQYFFINSVQPIKSFAIANTLTTLAGVAGRRYAFRGSTINLFTLIIGNSGAGKDASRKPLFPLKRALDEKGLLFGQFVGPEAASGQALFATLGEQPCYSVYTGELADELVMISSLRASDNNKTMCNAYLRLYDEQQFEGKVHRDSKNNVKAVERPAVTLMGSGTPDFFDQIEDHAIKRGLIPRFIILEHKGRTPAFNDSEFAKPHPKVLDGIKELVEAAIQNIVTDIGYADTPTEDLSMQYRKDIVDLQDSATTNIERGLYNRVHLNICRVASLLAACDNPKAPAITMEALEWAHSYLMYSLDNLVEKYKVGQLGGNMAVQREERLLELFADWYNMKPVKRGLYGKQLIPHSLFVPLRYLDARCKNIACFTKDQRGYDRAFKDTLYNMEITEKLAALTPDQKKQHGISIKRVYRRMIT